MVNMSKTQNKDRKSTSIFIPAWMKELTPRQFQSAIDLHWQNPDDSDEDEEKDELRSIALNRRGMSSKQIRNAVRKTYLAVK